MYIVIKTTDDKITQTGSLFEAARGHWRLDPQHASQCSHAIISIVGNKNIQDVIKIDKWYESTLVDNKYVFSGQRDKQLFNQLVGKQLNSNLCIAGAQNPIQYVEEQNLLQN